MTDPLPHLRVVRGAPDEIEVAALVAGLTAVTGGTEPDDVAPVAEWTNHVRVLRGTGGGASARSFGGRSGRHNADAWRWSYRS
ncbi:acyl-CoA carboxylase subunit epsilon [Paraoerskovia marina]|uniref:Acyl-CoA carboxylase epsilon subunit n=1 Tax=Paraoerskovia marina TaxID=545619 RepID=A0A1H1UKV5_9CELL|nr:acyl-CoA carboxylase subunit epsilon [Paraoerskovia marina]SDS72449.1 Acyl-CoA carboxylase epsilon subunit [Paraoerskovia marina]